MADSSRLSKAGFDTVMGLEATKYANEKSRPDDISFVSRYTKVEADRVLKRATVKMKEKRGLTNVGSVITCLNPTSKNMIKRINNIDKMKRIAPEIEQSSILVSSAIMSPNDLQDGAFTFTFKNVDALTSDPSLGIAVADVYEDFFNDTMEFGTKSYDWIGEIQYRSGSKPILLLPVATLQALKFRTPEDAINTKKEFLVGVESFDEMLSNRSIDDDFFWSKNNSTSAKDFIAQMDTKYILESTIPSFETFDVDIPLKYRSNSARITPEDDSFGVDYVAGLEEIAINIKKTLVEGDQIRFSENPGLLRIAGQKTTDYWKQRNEDFLNQQKYIPEDLVELDPNPENFKHTEHPILIELPAEAVVPIHVPGAPSEHIGYFVLLDQNGQPVTAEDNDSSSCGNAFTNDMESNINASYNALFGGKCCNNMSNKNISNSGNAIFQNLLDKYLKRRMQGIWNRSDMTISRFDAIASIMFYRLLGQKKTTVIFVPPTMLHYLAFDYKDDGTGLSKIEGLEYLLHLRTTLTMAKVMAAANEAVEHKKIEFDVDDKVANLEGIMDILSQVFIDKNKLSGSIDPAEIAKSLQSNKLTIVPKNMPGINNLNVEVSSTGGQSVRPDDSLMETLNSQIESQLDVPPGALNILSEPELARSWTSQHLYFSKKIIRFQRIWCILIKNLIRSYTTFSPKFQKALLTKIMAHSKKINNRDIESKTANKILDTNEKEYSSEVTRKPVDNQGNRKATIEDVKLMHAILDNVEVALPSPRIAVDKAQFEELRNYISSIAELADVYFNQELIPSEDQLAQAALPVAKAKWRRDNTIAFMEKLGAFTMASDADYLDLDSTPIIEFIQANQVLAARIQQQRESVGKIPESTGGFGDDGGGFGGDDEGGFGDDSGGEEDTGDFDDASGPDVSFDEPESESTEESSSESTSTPAEMYFNIHKNKK